MKSHLDFKKEMLDPKRGDSFTTDYYLEGWRTCTITIGNKWAKIKPMFGGGLTKKVAVKTLKKILYDMYWNSAATDAYYKALQSGAKRKPNTWRRNYE